jgi:ABC-type multidrug transport system ATPase subunit
VRILKSPSAREGEESGLHACGLTRSFAGRTVLAKVDLSIPPATLAVLEGANGAGKTTLLRIFATVVAPSAGRAYVDGFDVASSGASVRRRIGAAFVNERSLFWRLSGRENLQLFARTRGLSRRAAAVQVDELLEELDLNALADRWVADLSAGQRQRVIIARAALARPLALLIDEPLRGLDESGIARILAFLRRRADEGAAVLVTAPKLDELEAAADVLFRLREGAIYEWHDAQGVAT